MIRSKRKECPVCSCPFSNADEGIMSYIGSPIFKKRCPNCGAFFSYSHNDKFDDYYFVIEEPHQWDPFKITEKLPGIKKIIENNPATVILWEDGTKTMAKCQDGDVFDFEKGVLICSLKKLIGNKVTNELLKKIEKQPVYHDGYTGGMRGKEFRKYLKQEDVPKLCQTCKYLEKTTQEDPCYICLKRYWKDGLHHNWEPRK